MKFNFACIQNPRLKDDNISSHTVVGTLPTGETIEVTRRLNHWEVNLQIVIDGIVWHDSSVAQDEIRQVNILRESALNNRDNHLADKRSKIHNNALVLINKFV
jgi:hypothetical protein